jgi:hypothetical protein
MERLKSATITVKMPPLYILHPSVRLGRWPRAAWSHRPQAQYMDVRSQTGHSGTDISQGLAAIDRKLTGLTLAPYDLCSNFEHAEARPWQAALRPHG